MLSPFNNQKAATLNSQSLHEKEFNTVLKKIENPRGFRGKVISQVISCSTVG
ncbi:hypothetical protein DPMN_145083 [Dreissena polymorpha]|uniref:Uncharacterized protein n=1 Tax=Dreissena polymorpha TaxID=45954 RepID=A0A9D4F7Z2_DREPO|nr:hypothetical protein DPMN_145083 [Dreissena polymorpha]